MADTGQDIVVPSEMTLQSMINLEETTQKRFSFILDISGKYAVCTWRNYYKKDGKRELNDNGAYKLLPVQEKKVIVI